MLAITLVSPDPAALAEAAAAVRAALASRPKPLGEGALDLLTDGPPVETHQAVKAAVGERPVDFAVQPVENRKSAC
jgi:phosphoserine phosphatase